MRKLLLPLVLVSASSLHAVTVHVSFSGTPISFQEGTASLISDGSIGSSVPASVSVQFDLQPTLAISASFAAEVSWEWGNYRLVDTINARAGSFRPGADLVQWDFNVRPTTGNFTGDLFLNGSPLTDFSQISFANPFDFSIEFRDRGVTDSNITQLFMDGEFDVSAFVSLNTVGNPSGSRIRGLFASNEEPGFGSRISFGVVPEPSTGLLASLGLASLCRRSRKL